MPVHSPHHGNYRHCECGHRRRWRLGRGKEYVVAQVLDGRVATDDVRQPRAAQNFDIRWLNGGIIFVPKPIAISQFGKLDEKPGRC
jgi:hypothetical protein